MKKRFGNLLALLLFLAGCYPYPETSIVESDLDIVVTNFNDSVEFSNFSTYILADSVALLGDEDVDENDPFYANGYDEMILDEIRTQMGAIGYTEVFDRREADAGVVATGLRVLNMEIVNIPGWWWNYPGYGYWWDPWYGSPYPYYGGGYSPGWYSTYYTYEKGSLIINMVDLKTSEIEDTFIWTAFINGLIDDQTTITGDRLSQSIESAFKQSRNFYERAE